MYVVFAWHLAWDDTRVLLRTNWKWLAHLRAFIWGCSNFLGEAWVTTIYDIHPAERWRVFGAS